MIIGYEILISLEQLGPSELLRLKIDDLHAMLANADPQGSIPKPSKKTRHEKVNLMPIVQATIGRFFSDSNVLAPSLRPIPEVPSISEGEHLFNLQFEGPPENSLPISDPVFPYATDASADTKVNVAFA